MTTNNETLSNIPVEQQILGALIKDGSHSKSRETLDSLSDNDFYSMSHRLIFRGLQALSENKIDIDLITLENALEKAGGEYGGFIYLADIHRNSIGVYNLPAYVKIIKKCSQLRQLTQLISNANDLINQNADATEIIEQLECELKDAAVSSSGAELRHIKEVEGDWLYRLEDRSNRGGAIAGLCTGIDSLDERINGIGSESLIVVAGAPSMGKTLICQMMASNIGVDQKKDIMFFSMEMTEIELYERFISGIGNIPANNLRSARLGDDGYGKAEKAALTLRESGIYVTDQPKQSVGQIRAKARRHKAKKPNLSAIFIDYLGLMKLGKADRHDIAIGNVTRDLKELAKELRVPVILCAQANRYKAPARPNMGNLKDSSCIEADADVVLFVHRQEVLEPETLLKGVTELIVAKDRHSDGNGTIYLEKINGAFSSLSEEQVGMMEHQENNRLKPPKENTNRGMKAK
jgi:replicative DNA helicase